MASHKISLPIKDKNVESLLLWRDPKKSGVAFGAITLAFFLLKWTNFNLLSIAVNLLLITVVGTFLWNNFATIMKRPGVPVPKLLREGVTEGEVKSWASQATPVINKALAYAYRVFSGKEVFLSGQVALALFLLARVVAAVNLVTLLYVAVVLAFTLPKVYELKKPEIDQVVNKVSYETKKVYGQYVEPYVNKIPRASTAHKTSSTAPSKSPAEQLAETLGDVKEPYEPKKAI